MRMIAGLEKYDGKISVPTDKISFMFQEDRLIPFISVLKNVAAVSDVNTAKKYLAALECRSPVHFHTPQALLFWTSRLKVLTKCFGKPL